VPGEESGSCKETRTFVKTRGSVKIDGLLFSRSGAIVVAVRGERGVSFVYAEEKSMSFSPLKYSEFVNEFRA
jgi:hypothetical protein